MSATARRGPGARSARIFRVVAACACIWVCASLHGYAQEARSPSEHGYAQDARCASAAELSAACNASVDRGAPGERGERRAGDIAEFLAGAAIGLGIHEGGHVVAASLFDASPGVKGIHYGVVPFFAVTHREGLSDRREFTVAAAGLWAEQAASEAILSRRPGLRAEHAPIDKGILAFHLVSSAIYGVAGLARTGPPERDTRAMAAASGISERWIGAIVLAPAVFDTWRYFRPHSRVARWAARAARAGGMLLVFAS